MTPRSKRYFEAKKALRRPFVREGVFDWKFTFGNGTRTMLALSKFFNPTNN